MSEYIVGMEYRWKPTGENYTASQEWSEWTTLTDLKFGISIPNLEFRVKPGYEIVKEEFEPSYFKNQFGTVKFFDVKPPVSSYDQWKRVNVTDAE